MILIKELLIIAILYYWFVAVCEAEINSKPCRKGKVNSEVNEVSIEPCPEGGVCELFKGTNATITVRFTPHKIPSSSPACNIKSKLTWVSKTDMDFGNISSDACELMNCPLIKNTETVFSTAFFISKMWPTGVYPLKLRLYDKTAKQLYLCQVFKIKILDKPADIVVN